MDNQIISNAHADSTNSSSTAITILRWIGVLPGALIGSLILAVLVCVMCLIGDILDGSFWLYLKHPEVISIEHFFTPFIVAAVFCGTFVHIGANIAPDFKKQIAFALSILLIIPFGLLAFFAVSLHEWKLLAQFVLGIVVAAIVAYYWVSEQAKTR